jgi:hypothetical protein
LSVEITFLVNSRAGSVVTRSYIVDFKKGGMLELPHQIVIDPDTVGNRAQSKFASQFTFGETGVCAESRDNAAGIELRKWVAYEKNKDNIHMFHNSWVFSLSGVL